MSVIVRPLTPGIAVLRPQAGDVAGGQQREGVSASSLFRSARLAVTVAVGLGVVALLVCGWFARYTSHAFQMADLLRQSGFLGGQVTWYQGWTGRFGSNATWLVAAAAPPGLVRILPTAYLLLWGAVLWTALPRVAAQMGRELAGTARLLAVEVVLLATLVVTPALWFDLYKLTGSVTYITPLVLGTAAVGLVLGAMSRGRLDGRRALALALLCFFAMSYSDTFAGVVPVLIAFLAVCAVRVRARRGVVARRALLIAASAGGSGLAVMLHAPGNAVRRSLYPAPPRLFTAIGWSIRDARDFLAGPVARNAAVILGVAVVFGALGLSAAPRGEARGATGLPHPGSTLRRVLLALAGVAAVVVTAHLPAEQMTSAPPPARSELIPTYALVLFVAFVSWTCAVSLAQRRSLRAPRRATLLALAVATAAAAAVPAVTMVQVAQSWRSMSAYATAEDVQWTLAENARPGADLVVPPAPSSAAGPLSHDDLQELQPDPRYWTNQAFAQYFGLHSVRVAATR